MLSDLAVILQDAGSVVVYKTYSTYGILFNDPTEALQMSDKQYAVSDTELTLTIAIGSIGIIDKGVNIVVDSISYKINKYIVLSGGSETKLWLSKA